MASAMIREVFATVDAGDAHAFASFFAENAKMVFGNQPGMIGPAAIEAGVSGFFGMIKGLRHSITNEWVVGNDAIIELAVTYYRLDGKTVTIPVVSIWTTNAAEKITDYRVFFDLAPVFA